MTARNAAPYFLQLGLADAVDADARSSSVSGRSLAISISVRSGKMT